MTPDEDAGGARATSDAAGSAASAACVGHVVVGADERVASATPSIGQFLGSDSSTLVGEPLTSLFHPADGTAVREAVETAANEDGRTSRVHARLAFSDAADDVAIEVTETRGDETGRFVVAVFSRSGRSDATTDLARFADSLEELHDATNRLHASQSIEECAEIVIEAAVGVLGFDWCLLAAPTDDMFRIEAVSDGAPLAVGDRPLAVGEGVAGHVYRTNAGTVTADSSASERSEPTHDIIRSSLTAPVGDWGVFQALSESVASFDETDLKLAEVLATSMATTIERIEQERQLRIQRNKLQHQYARIESLHTVATEMKGLDTRDAVYDAVIGAAEEILAFDICIIDELEDDVLVPKAVGSGLSIEDYYAETPIDREDNIAAQTIREEETILVSDLRATAYAPAQSDYRSILSVPIDDWGVFQAGSETAAAFDDTDRRLTELLIAHAVATVDRIDREHELERRATELERQNERLDEFGSLVSHDLRTPLSIATGYLENARTECEHEALEEVATALDRMDALIDDMLALARGGRDELTIESVALEPLLRDRWADLGASAASLERHATLPETVRGDERRLEQLFDNLFRNAVEHGSTNRSEPGTAEDTAERGSTSPASRTQQDAAERDVDGVTVRVGGLDERGFYVADDGPGIPERERDRVFEHGHSGGGGTGLGLAIVADIVDVHGWEIELTEGESGGARFEIRTDPGA